MTDFTRPPDGITFTSPLRFCNAVCYDSYMEDGRQGCFRLPISFPLAGHCRYCGEYVPTNAQRRLGGLVYGPARRRLEEMMTWTR